MNHRVALVMLAGQAGEIEFAVGSTPGESALIIALCFWHARGPA